jgi:hypothetical protein
LRQQRTPVTAVNKYIRLRRCILNRYCILKLVTYVITLYPSLLSSAHNIDGFIILPNIFGHQCCTRVLSLYIQFRRRVFPKRYKRLRWFRTNRYVCVQKSMCAVPVSIVFAGLLRYWLTKELSTSTIAPAQVIVRADYFCPLMVPTPRRRKSIAPLCVACVIVVPNLACHSDDGIVLFSYSANLFFVE